MEPCSIFVIYKTYIDNQQIWRGNTSNPGAEWLRLQRWPNHLYAGAEWVTTVAKRSYFANGT